MPDRETRKQKARQRMAATRARYGAQVNVSSSEDRCCCCHAAVARVVINILFVLGGILVLAFGVWATSGKIGGVFGALPGVGLIIVAVLLILTAILGEYGARADNKCILLIYFLVVFAAFAVFAVSGIVVLASGPGGNDSVASAWCAFPESAARAQDTFSCCGFHCPSDLPALGSCPDGATYNGTAPQCEADHSSEAVCSLPVASRPVHSSLLGCRSVAVSYVEERIIPLFAVALTTGLVLFIAMAISCRLLCKRSRPSDGSGGRAVEDGVHLNDAKAGGSDWIEASAAASSSSASGPRTLDP